MLVSIAGYKVVALYVPGQIKGQADPDLLAGSNKLHMQHLAMHLASFESSLDPLIVSLYTAY